MLHHFLCHHNFGEASITLHADNCSGQNKNWFVMQYLAWRVMSGLNKKAEISFMLVGHTKFAPDWCFGLLKQKFRRTKVGCLDDIVQVVEESSTVNHAQLVGREDGSVIVPQYNWSEFFSQYFKRNAFAGIKSLHHLVFADDKPGVATVRETTDGAEKNISVLSSAHKNWKPASHDLPPLITPEGLSRERREYLFDKIAPSIAVTLCVPTQICSLIFPLLQTTSLGIIPLLHLLASPLLLHLIALVAPPPCLHIQLAISFLQQLPPQLFFTPHLFVLALLGSLISFLPVQLHHLRGGG
jgi:hypothetical protein